MALDRLLDLLAHRFLCFSSIFLCFSYSYVNLQLVCMTGWLDLGWRTEGTEDLSWMVDRKILHIFLCF